MLDRAHAATGVAWVAKDGRRFADVDAAPAAAAAAPRDSFTISLWAKPDIDLRLMPDETIRGRINETGKNYLVSARSGRDMHGDGRSEEHTSELQSLMRNSYAVFCLQTKNN